MAGRPNRVVAEIGRPETPQETADRKAAASRTYRASQTTRNLIAALLVTLAVVAVIIFIVPRGQVPERPPIDVAAAAASASAAEERPVIAPVTPQGWRVNVAAVEGNLPRAWTIVYATETGFVRVEQGFDADPAWPSRELAGSAVDGTVDIGGITWDRYVIRNPERAGNITSAISTSVGDDVVMVFGAADDETIRVAAEAVAPEILTLAEEAQ
ncbi:DUF4245 family protein [Microbacterium aurantiacum]|uniref:DUF4245 family protein n=1 Tax=Microbacterium aurantiacum TaxID=162393 RepID=UPI003418E3AA